MPVVRSSSSVSAVLISLALMPLVAAQVSLPGVQSPTRDSAPQPTERRVPVGTSTISGTVVDAATGRPLRNARVQINGQIQALADAVMAGRGETAMRGSVPAGRGVVGGLGPQAAGLAGVSRSAVTDATGQFTISRLPAGLYQAYINHNQYLSLNYGQRRHGGQATYFRLNDGQQFALKAALQKGGVITGTVFSADGDPLQNVSVRGWRYTRVNGFKRLQTSGFAQTDDRGTYRLFNLQPGDYMISATPNQDYNAFNPQMEQMERAIATAQVQPPTAPGLPPTVAVPIPQAPSSGSPNIQPQYLHTFAPSSPLPSGSTVVTVVPGEERTGVDVFTRLIQATTIQAELASPLENGVTAQMQLINDDPTIDATDMGSSRLDQNGRVFFRGVRPGKYTLIAMTVPAPPPMMVVNGFGQEPTGPPPVLTDAQKLWARVPVSVDGDSVMQVRVTLQPPRNVSGVVLFDMPQPPDLTRTKMTVSLQLAPAPQQIYYNALPGAQVGPDGRFTLTGVSPGRYLIRTNTGGVLRSAMSGGQDTLDFPLEGPLDRDVSDVVITVTGSATELGGILSDSTGKPSPDYTIVVASVESRYWTPGSRRIAMQRPGPDGRYSFRALPPGQYFIAAVVDPEQGIQYDPEFLKELAGAAVSITINDGGKTTQDLRVK